MSELNDRTRIVQLAADVSRERAPNERTRCETGRVQRVVLVDHRALFNRHQRRLHQVLRELAQPGFAIFALHPQHGIVGRLWLSATDQVRAGTIGRHSKVDLHLPHDEELSLRHLLILVKASPGGQRIQALDLATPGGFQAEQGGVLRAVDANGSLILRAASYSLFCFPTGTTPSWEPNATEPWLSLPARVLVADGRVTAQPANPRARRRSSLETNVSFREGPSEPGPAPVLEPGEDVEGRLVLSTGGSQVRLPVGARALDRGIILGRYSRCTGDTVEMSNLVSRVHAMLVRIDGALHLIDAGSTNGTSTAGRHVKCEPMMSGQIYELGKMFVRWEPSH